MKIIKPIKATYAASLVLLLLAGLVSQPACADSAGIRDEALLKTTDGGQIYAQICQGCHMPKGQGAIGAGHYPAFAHNPTMSSAPYMALTILGGRRNMPAFASRDPGDSEQESFIAPIWLTDAQVASVINYIRTHFGNDYKDAITADEVKALHPGSTR
ncbi:cytochrome c [Rhodanobacter sp. A1T4]|jgi:mono/diheme cytochrome c family protein|uniref:c-type cytochrome n=1 Tax=Rhodanobacter sp. A1T4 TaxID=2723087 RepID=UPI001616D838|nr:cytochrome c [Rhodanobacter sp. A1T4]MBB6245996.1 mono/diheme cytochrome c family protein [Rhodanobacter sp. A1T4]